MSTIMSEDIRAAVEREKAREAAIQKDYEWPAKGTYYKFLAENFIGPHARHFSYAGYLPEQMPGDEEWLPGAWLPFIRTPRLEFCHAGYHYTDKEHILRWSDYYLYELQVSYDRIDTYGDAPDWKGAARTIRLVRPMEYWNIYHMGHFVIECAERAMMSVIASFDSPFGINGRNFRAEFERVKQLTNSSVQTMREYLNVAVGFTPRANLQEGHHYESLFEMRGPLTKFSHSPFTANYPALSYAIAALLRASTTIDGTERCRGVDAVTQLLVKSGQNTGGGVAQTHRVWVQERMWEYLDGKVQHGFTPAQLAQLGRNKW